MRVAMAQLDVLESKLEVVFTYDAKTTEGAAMVFVKGNTPLARRYSRTLTHDSPLAECHFAVRIPGVSGRWGQHVDVGIERKTSSRRSTFLNIMYLRNYLTFATQWTAFVPAITLTQHEEALTKRVAQRLLCFVAHKLLQMGLIGMNTMVVLTRGDDLFDKKLEHYYNSLGFQAYEHSDDTLFPSRRFVSAMEAPVHQILRLCPVDLKLASQPRRRKQPKRRKAIRRRGR